MVSKKRLWDWFLANGPASLDEAARSLDVPRDEVAHCYRELTRNGYLIETLDRRVEACDTDNIRVRPSPFGAGAGDTRSGDPPKDEEPSERYR